MGEETDGVQYEQDKIKITSTIQQPHLLLCVETLLGMDEKDFTLKMITDESYILVFNSAYTIKGIIIVFLWINYVLCVFSYVRIT